LCFLAIQYTDFCQALLFSIYDHFTGDFHAILSLDDIHSTNLHLFYFFCSHKFRFQMASKEVNWDLMSNSPFNVSLASWRCIMCENIQIISIVLLVAGHLSAGTTGDFYDETILRTLTLDFEQADWWSQLEANYQAKENILATLTVDEQVYNDVGIRFRGNTSYQRVDSEKKPFNIEIDYTHDDQRLMGYKTLNLINCNGDPTFMREVLYSNTCRAHIPSAKANFVTLVINGKNWGVYANGIQQSTINPPRIDIDRKLG
jgi:hypothetical protein